MPTRKGQSKKNAPRAAKVDRWGPDYLPTDPNSPLVSTDLIVNCDPLTISPKAHLS